MTDLRDLLESQSGQPPEKCASPAHGEGPAAKPWEGLFRGMYRGDSERSLISAIANN